MCFLNSFDAYWQRISRGAISNRFKSSRSTQVNDCSSGNIPEGHMYVRAISRNWSAMLSCSGVTINPRLLPVFKVQSYLSASLIQLVKLGFLTFLSCNQSQTEEVYSVQLALQISVVYFYGIRILEKFVINAQGLQHFALSSTGHGGKIILLNSLLLFGFFTLGLLPTLRHRAVCWIDCVLF